MASEAESDQISSKREPLFSLRSGFAGPAQNHRALSLPGGLDLAGHRCALGAGEEARLKAE